MSLEETGYVFGATQLDSLVFVPLHNQRTLGFLSPQWPATGAVPDSSPLSGAPNRQMPPKRMAEDIGEENFFFHLSYLAALIINLKESSLGWGSKLVKK